MVTVILGQCLNSTILEMISSQKNPMILRKLAMFCHVKKMTERVLPHRSLLTLYLFFLSIKYIQNGTLCTSSSSLTHPEKINEEMF